MAQSTLLSIFMLFWAAAATDEACSADVACDGVSLIQRDIRTHVGGPSGEALQATTNWFDIYSALSKAELAGNFPNLMQTDVCSAVHQPSTDPYNFTNSVPDDSYSQIGQDKLLNPILGSIQNGFFIESGAADGETNSNTIFYEKRGWTGLLVEPYPVAFEKLLSKNRKSYAYNGGLSTTGAAGTVTLKVRTCGGYAAQCSDMLDDSDAGSEGAVQVEIVPLLTLLDCIGRRTVDFWSLDVEGVEAMILEGTPFDQIEVGVMLIEMDKSDENNNRINGVMTKNGFNKVGTTDFDGIYVNPKYFTSRGLSVPESI